MLLPEKPLNVRSIRIGLQYNMSGDISCFFPDGLNKLLNLGSEGTEMDLVLLVWFLHFKMHNPYFLDL